MIFLFNKFQYHIIAVSFLRSAMRIYNSVHYGGCVSLYSFNPFSLPKRKKTCSQPELLFFSCRVPKTIVASWFAIRKRFCASGKFLRITLEIALESFQMVWKVSGLSGKLQDGLESFRISWKVSGLSGKCPDGMGCFGIILKISK